MRFFRVKNFFSFAARVSGKRWKIAVLWSGLIRSWNCNCFVLSYRSISEYVIFRGIKDAKSFFSMLIIGKKNMDQNINKLVIK